MFSLIIACHMESAIRDHILFSTFIRTSVTLKLSKLTLILPTLVASNVKTPSARLLGYGKSTADCHFGIAGDFFINGMGLRPGIARILMSKSAPQLSWSLRLRLRLRAAVSLKGEPLSLRYNILSMYEIIFYILDTMMVDIRIKKAITLIKNRRYLIGF